MSSLKEQPKGNDHKKVTPSTAGKNASENDQTFTSYDTSEPETNTPQKVREAIEPEGEEKRRKEQSK